MNLRDTMDMNKKRQKTIRASLTVEAAVVVPVMIVLMLPFLYLLKATLIYETIRFSLAETGDSISQTAYLYDRLGLKDIHRLYNHEQIQQKTELECADVMAEDSWLQTISGRIQDIRGIVTKAEAILSRGALTAEGYIAAVNILGRELTANYMEELLSNIDLEALGVKSGIHGLDYSASKFFYQDGEYQDLIALIATYELDFPEILGLRFPSISIQVQTRAFTGQPTMGFDEAGGQGDDVNACYYQIGRGSHYHIMDCYLIKSNLEALSQETAQQNGYAPCQRCRPDQSHETVYVTQGGRHFHRHGCAYIHPDLRQITEREIQDLGLQPCVLCLGGGGGFRE